MKSNNTKIRILLAEDNAINQIYIKYILTKHDFIVDTAYNGLQVIEKFENNKYDIILMDWFMSKMDGFEAARIIREKSNNLDFKIPIIAITGYDIDKNSEKVINAQINFFMSKPINEEQLIKRIHELTSLKKK